jgi:phosphatidate cytidylyltransferase
VQQRVISGVAVAALVTGLLFWSGGPSPFPGWPFALLVAALTLAALSEFYRGCRTAGIQPLEGFGYATALLLLAVATPVVRDPDGVVTRFALTVLLAASLVAEAVRPDRAPLRNLGALWLGAFYVGWLFPFTLRLRMAGTTARQHLDWTLPEHWMALAGEGVWLVGFTIAVTSATDIAALLVGRAIGRRKLAPHLSPGKTVEGALGGFAGALAMAAALSLWLRMPADFALTAGALIGVVSQLGDLSKSAFKREIGIKDFGTLIPGHGGVLDRFDSLLFTAPTVYWLLILWQR